MKEDLKKTMRVNLKLIKPKLKPIKASPFSSNLAEKIEKNKILDKKPSETYLSRVKNNQQSNINSQIKNPIMVKKKIPLLKSNIISPKSIVSPFKFDENILLKEDGFCGSTLLSSSELPRVELKQVRTEKKLKQVEGAEGSLDKR